jgi:voltage-gated potassium channel
MSIKRRLYYLIFLIFVVILAGSTGYYLMFGAQPRFMDCVYMTVVSLTTVGYGEVLPITGNVPAQIYTMVLITFGMGVILYGISTFTALLVEGELSGILRKNTMLNRIKKLKGHTIVCGGGRTGRLVIAELAKNKEPVVLIENDPASLESCRSIDDLLYIQGDATDDENLFAAGLANAAGIIITLGSDKDNLYVTMSARMHKRNLRIISRMVDQTLEPKLRKAGADSVVSPNLIGALRMASEMIRPTAVDFLDQMLRSSRGNLRIHEIPIAVNSDFDGKKIYESGLKDTYDLLVLGAKFDDNEIRFNPPPQTVLKAGMRLIVMGEVERIDAARQAAKAP